LSSYFIIILEAGHNSKAAAIGIAPLMLAGFIMAYRNKNWILGSGLAALFFALELSMNHIQITYYMLIVMLFLGIVELVRYIKENRLTEFFKVTGLLVLGYVLAVMVNYGNIFGTAEYAKQTIRGGTELTIKANGESNADIATDGLDREYVTNWSYGIGETFTLMVPNFKGGESIQIGAVEENREILKDVDRRFQNDVAQRAQYFGEQPFTSGPVYPGIIVLFLAVLALVYIKDNYKWALLSATLLAITLSWGKNFVSVLVILPILLYMVNILLDKKKQVVFTTIVSILFLFIVATGDAFSSTSLTNFFLDYVPGYDKLRAVTIILAVVELTLPLLAIIFLQKLVQERDQIKADIKRFYIVSGVFVFILAVFYLAPTAVNDFTTSQELASFEQYMGTDQESTVNEFIGELEGARIAVFKSDVGRSIGFLILAVGLVFVFVRANFSKFVFLGGLGFLIFIDLLMVDTRYVNSEDYEKSNSQWTEVYNKKYPFVASDGEKAILSFELQENPSLADKIDSALTELDNALAKEKDVKSKEKQLRKEYVTFRTLNRFTNFRVMDQGNPFNSSTVSYFFKSIGGYHGAKLGRYQDLIEFHISNNNPQVLNMLNMKYRIGQVRDPKTGAVKTQITKINKAAMGNVWFTPTLQVVNNADEEILAMNAAIEYKIASKGNGKLIVNGNAVDEEIITSKDQVGIELDGMTEFLPIQDIPYDQASKQSLALIIDSTGLNWVYDSAPDSMFQKIFAVSKYGEGGWDPSQTTLVDKRYENAFSSTTYSAQGNIEMSSYHPDEMVYTSNSSEKQFAVFSEIYYEDGWKAFVDNEEVPLARVNYVLRGIEVPAGEHTIKLEFKMPSYERSSTIALVGSLMILILIAIGVYFAFKGKSAEQNQQLDEA
jgi:hypothetical protein